MNTDGETASPASGTSSLSDTTVCVIGAGYVGLVTAAALASGTRSVRLLDVSPERVSLISAGTSPIYEPGLEDLVASTVAGKTLSATSDPAIAMSGAGIVVIAVGTPPLPSGGADLGQVELALASALRHAGDGAVIVLKSTVPPGTMTSLKLQVDRSSRVLALVSCPEFLREGLAIQDVLTPARVVVGGYDDSAADRVAEVFAAPGTPVLRTDPTSAEMIKYGSNAFLALKISFINEIAYLCELTGAEVDQVADGIGADPRIGRAFLNAGAGFGGSCFPKDVDALEDTAGKHGHFFWLLRAATEVNLEQRRRIVNKVEAGLHGGLRGKRIAVLGIAFKPGTDDVRQAPALDVIDRLLDRGATVRATDPIALGNLAGQVRRAELVADPYECVIDADAVIVMTEWPEYRELDWARVSTLVSNRLIVDGRNCLDATPLTKLGFTYLSVGRKGRTPQA